MTNSIKIHNSNDFKNMRLAGQLAAECLDFITDFIKPGISTKEISYISPLWTYKFLTLLSVLMISGELFAFLN